MTDAEAKAWRAARSLAQHDGEAATALTRRAELAVIRRFVTAQLPGDEAEYWQLVEQELGE